ncbi:hypothetical protein IHE49_12780 [Rhodanobacter sp. 7MK24]|uniref:hypothetical protein n=1 Tax=Rhodanobacter sp. 7MK24 TaxID=2775922 RepID=UPI001784D809|nr:hypothetical protein [Rhodanobacter sp. 7MK24]MBD8881359.1 hypothetical protein [Rhodanobacter sp. 7MK24]
MELKTTENPIETADPATQVLSNLFYGWGYNFYRKENQLRADDLLIRAKVSEMLGQMRAHLAGLERDWRREHLPAPTREHPFPDAAAIATAQALQRAQQGLESLETKVRTAPVPEMDRVTQRHVNERDALERLAAVDGDLVMAVKSVFDAAAGLLDPATAAGALSAILAHSGVDALLARRAEVLSVVAVT